MKTSLLTNDSGIQNIYQIKHRYLIDSKGDKRSKNIDSLIKFEYIES